MITATSNADSELPLARLDHLASSQAHLVARARRIRHGQDGGAGKRPDQMNFTLVPLLLAIQPVTSCANIISLTVASTSADNAPSARTSAIPLAAHQCFRVPAIALAAYPINEARPPIVHHLTRTEQRRHPKCENRETRQPPLVAEPPRRYTEATTRVRGGPGAATDVTRVERPDTRGGVGRSTGRGPWRWPTSSTITDPPSATGRPGITLRGLCCGCSAQPPQPIPP